MSAITGTIFTLLLIFAYNLCFCKVNATNNKRVHIFDNVYPLSWKQVTTNKTSKLSVKANANSSDANQNTWYRRGYINGGREFIWERIRFLAPAFTLSSDKIIEELCRKENDMFLSQLKELKLWALKMYDSSGKATSGILNGNVNQFGDFDQCLSVNDETSGVKGKYCLTYVQIKPNGNFDKEILQIYDLAQSHQIFRSTMNDPGHRVPRFSAINWAVCVPSSCSHKEIETQLRETVRRFADEVAFDVSVKVDAEMCYIKKPYKLSLSFMLASVLLGSVVILVILSTVKDFAINETSADDSLLSCFSLKKNVKQLLNTERASGDIETIHGIRMANALMLVIAHKAMALLFSPYPNRTYLAQNLTQPWTIFARIASVYTDSFILISGILTSYSFSKTLQKKGTLNIKREYINRLIRIFPLLAVTILFSTLILPELGSGPQWGLTVRHHSESCKSSWWKNFLFVHNYYGFENMCLTHTHHLGIDTQLFFLSPILVYILHKWQLIGFGFLIALAAISTGLRYHSTVSKELSFFLYPGMSVRRMMDTANYSYIIPSHRLTVYIIGLINGYVLNQCGRDYKIKSNLRRLCWTTSSILFCYIISKAMSMNYLGYEYDKSEAAIYSSVTPIAWCLFLSWIIFASHINCGGLLGRILSSKYCIIWTRISYAVYLIQFPIFFFNVGRLRYPEQFSFFTAVNVFEYASILISAVVLTLFFDMPSNNLRKLVIRHRQK